jgi:hypothetical protein
MISVLSGFWWTQSKSIQVAIVERLVGSGGLLPFDDLDDPRKEWSSRNVIHCCPGIQEDEDRRVERHASSSRESYQTFFKPRER